MKIIYKQCENDSIFTDFGIRDCFLKELFYKKEPTKAAKKLHYHTFYEIHIIISGYQIYEIGDDTVFVNEGEFLMISPDVRHRLKETKKGSCKYSIVFGVNKKIEEKIANEDLYIVAKTSKNIIENIDFILSEAKNHKELSLMLIKNRMFENVVSFLRLAGLKEETAQKQTEYEDYRLILVKQYIEDNIGQALTVSELARYCHLSQKQLTRIFYVYEEIPPLEYLQKRKTEYIKKLLIDDGIPIKEISERMNFTNEYYFNSYFKKYFGMPPGRYKKMYTGRE